MQLQFEDGIGLLGREGLVGVNPGRAAAGVDVDFLAAEVGDKVLASVSAVGAAANDGDHIVEMIERLEIAFENVLAVFRLRQKISGAAADYVDAMLDEIFDGLDDAHLAGLSVD